MKVRKFITWVSIFGAVLFTTACNDAKTTTEGAASTTTAAAVTNPLFAIAPIEYAELAEKSLKLLGSMDYDAWSATLADTIIYSFPDGDQNTRTTVNGKKAIVDWYKNFKTVSGLQSMTMSEFNSMPINVTGEAKGGASKGIYVISYFSNTFVFKTATVPVRMNFSLHFNADKKIDRCTSYYDRTNIVKALGVNLLEAKK
jgi:hypothetical protein